MFSATFARVVSRWLFQARRSLAHLAVAALVLLAATADSWAADGTKHAAVGKKLPRLELQGLTGDSAAVKLTDLSGHVVLIHFWGTWCPPCVEEFPHIDRMATEYVNRDDFRLFAVSSAEDIDPDLDELRGETEAFLKTLKSELPTYADVADRTRSSVERTAGWRGYPNTVVLDGEGVIRGVWPSHAKGIEKQMQALIEELLKANSRRPGDVPESDAP
jgi:thiol-disulfide isomerase/thioredoxin